MISLIVLSLGWVMIYADRVSISPLMNLIRDEFHLSFFSVSLLLSIYFLGYVAFTIPAAVIADRWGYKRTMVLFFGLIALSLAFAGVFGTSYYLLLLFLGLHGIGAGAYYPTAFRISTATSVRENLGLSSAIINSGMGLGLVLGLIIAGPILELVPSWQTIFIILSVPTLLVALFLRYFVAYKEERVTSSFRLLEYGKLLKNRSFVFICMAMFCSLYGYWVILSWAPSYLQTNRNLGIFSSGLTIALFAVIAVPSSLSIGRLSDGVGRRKVASVILPLASLAIVLMTFTNSLVVFIIAIAAYGVVGKLTLDPIAVAWVGEIIPSESLGAALALLNVFAMASSIFAPIITGALADLTGTLAIGFYLGAAIVFSGTVFLLLVKQRA